MKGRKCGLVAIVYIREFSLALILPFLSLSLVKKGISFSEVNFYKTGNR